jgi:hypothetical protein
MAREAGTIRDKLAPLGKRVKKARDSGKQWDDIAEEEGEGQGKCMLAYLCVTEELVTAKNEDMLNKRIVALRDNQQLSWGVISARVDRTEGHVRTVYLNETGVNSRGLRIGKGGRYVNGDGPPEGSKSKAPVKKVTKVDKAKNVAKAAKEKAAARKSGGATKKAAPVKKASGRAASPKGGTSTAPSGKKSPLLDMTLGALKDRLEGESITVLREGTTKTEKFTVKTVKSSADGVLDFTDARTGNVRHVRIEDIKAASTTQE